MFHYNPAQGPRLVLQISALEPEYTVRVIASPAAASFSDPDIAPSALVVLHDVLSLAEQPVFHEQVGKMLFDSLFKGRTGEAYRAANRAAAALGERLTLELQFERSALAMTRYPWELLHDGTHFLLMRGAINLVRSLPFPSPLPVEPVEGPLDALIVEALPDDLPAAADAYEGLVAALDSHIRADKLDLAYLMPPSWDSLMDWLLAGAPQILHIAGYSDVSGGGWLILADDANDSDRVPALVVGQTLYNTGLKLVMLSAAPLAGQGGAAVWGTAAPGLILGGVPAVAALQSTIPTAEGLRFVRGMYRALLAGHDLETALLAGRQELSRTPYWHCPVLYRRAEPIADDGPVALPCRVDMIAPQAALVHLPLRVGVWLRAAGAAPPADDVVRRLIGCSLHTMESLPKPVQEVTRSGVLEPGMAHIRMTVEGGEVHGAVTKSVPVKTGMVVPPVWFPITPHVVGEVPVRVEVRQAGGVLATGTHILHVTDQDIEDPVAVLTVAQFAPCQSDDDTRASGEFAAVPVSPPSTPEGTPWRDHEPGGAARKTASFPVLTVREPDQRTRTGRRELEHDRQVMDAEPSQAKEEARMFDEALDGVLDWFQSGEEPPPEELDPLISGEYVPHVRDAVDDSPVVGHVLEKGEMPSIDAPPSSLDVLPTVVDVLLPDEPTVLLDRTDAWLMFDPVDAENVPGNQSGDYPVGSLPEETVPPAVFPLSPDEADHMLSPDDLQRPAHDVPNFPPVDESDD